MMNINIIAVGKLKESYLREAAFEYAKRLSGFCRLNIIELPESRLSENPSQKDIQNALANEAKLIEEKINKKQMFNIALCVEGKQLSSEELSQKICDAGVIGKSTINFIIGSSFGISPNIKSKADFKLSMSKMTFPHQLARILLLEQIYRAFQISSGGKYHK